MSGPREPGLPDGLSIAVNVSPGELIDKLTILELKLSRIVDPAKLANVRREHELLKRTADLHIATTARLAELRSELYEANTTIWDVEDQLRDHERRQDFGEAFVSAARRAYQANDQRSLIKRRINELLGSALIEEKSHS